MICVRCGYDSKARERSGGLCPSCRKEFAFAPGGHFTDKAFAGALDAVSASGHVRWGVEHLYYELSRRLGRRNPLARLLGGMQRTLGALFATGVAVLAAAALLVGGIGERGDATNGRAVFALVALIATAVAVRHWVRLARGPRQHYAPLDRGAFDALWQRWLAVHGTPPALIVRRQAPPANKRRAESDIGDYSFDRAVICDRARTVDLLLANNFHFENNCAVLAISGYPAGPFETVRAMLRRNPRLHVFALHDATPTGCRMAYRLAHDPDWFGGHAPVTDVGLRPRHAGPFQGLLLRAEEGPVAPGQGLDQEEAVWLSQYALELAAIRPEQVLKRLFAAINGRSKGESDRQSDGSSGVWYDNESFGTDASDSDGGADSFG